MRSEQTKHQLIRNVRKALPGWAFVRVVAQTAERSLEPVHALANSCPDAILLLSAKKKRGEVRRPRMPRLGVPKRRRFRRFLRADGKTAKPGDTYSDSTQRN